MRTTDMIASVNGRYAYVYKNGGDPIYHAEQMLLDKPLVCNPIDEDWQNRINTDCWWASGYTGNDCGSPLEMELIKKLLSFGGYEACVEYQDADAKNLLERGQLWYGDHAILIKGAPNQCHRNACNLWLGNCTTHEVAVATGYALSNDGLWRQHSWLLQRKSRSVQVIETTMKRIAYFGYVMTEAEAKQFCSENF